MPALVSVDRAAQLAGLPSHELRAHVADGRLDAVLVDGRLFVARQALQRWAETVRGAHTATGTGPGTSDAVLCPGCGEPLVAVRRYVSARFGDVAACPNGPGYFTTRTRRPLRVFDLVAVPDQPGLD